MTPQDSVEARKAASAAGAAGNSGLGVDGDDLSVADRAAERDDQPDGSTPDAAAAPADPVTGTTGNAAGEEQAADNQERESPS